MPKISKQTVEAWRKRVSDWLADNHNASPSDVKTGSQAWGIAHTLGIVREAHEDRSVLDAHIQTALEQIFPNAVFKSKKIY